MTFPAVIGVTGLPCSGKSLAAELLASGAVDGREGELLKADDAGHRVLTRADVVERLRERFGHAAIDPADSTAMRRTIASRVFSNPSELHWLESVVHPLVTEELDAVLERLRGVKPVIVEAALLFAAGMETRCDRILVIEASFATRLRRAGARGWDREELERRQSRQLSLFEAAWNGPERHKLVRVENESDAGALRASLARVLSA